MGKLQKIIKQKGNKKGGENKKKLDKFEELDNYRGMGANLSTRPPPRRFLRSALVTH